MICQYSIANGQSELTTTGTDFWLGYMNNYDIGEDSLVVFISSEQASSGVVELPLLGWSQAFTTTVGQTTSIELPAELANNDQSAVIANRGVHVTSDAPISVYALNQSLYTTDAALVLPKTFLDTQYFVQAYEGIHNLQNTWRSELLIVSTEDDTELIINPSCDMLGGPLQGVPFTIQLNQGETFLLQAIDGYDVSGTIITGTEASGDCRPFAVFGGSECSWMCGSCDHLFDQMIPSSIWGTEYFLVDFQPFEKYTYRVTATQNGTQVFVDGVAAFNLNSGEYQEVTGVQVPVYISSNQPVGVIQYMEGCAPTGDPSMLSANSLGQTLNQVTFTTMDSQVITDHHVQIIVPTSSINAVFIDGFVIPQTSFSPFAGNNAYSFADIEIPQGSHQINCQQGFIANLYGIGEAESYLYSSGAQVTLADQIPNALCSLSQVSLQTSENFTNVWWSTIEDPETEIFTGQPFVINPPITNQIYVLHGNNFLSGCPEEVLYSVESPAPLSVNITESVVDLCLFEEFTLTSAVSPIGSSYSYQWLEPEAFITNDGTTAVISPWESGVYYLQVSTFSGCSIGIDSIQVNVLNDDITSIHAEANPTSMCEGETVNLEAHTGFNTGLDFFNSPNLNNTIWDEMSGGVIGELCGSVGGSSLIFNGNANRFIESDDLMMTNGGAVQFQIRISDGSMGCDGAEPGEDVLLQYSTNGGANWSNLFSLFEDAYPNFSSVEVVLPAAAETPATRFRWIQPQFSGINQDIWWLDNVVFSTYSTNPAGVSWSSSTNISNPTNEITSSQPTEDTYFYLETSINGCAYTDSILVEVFPTFELIVSNDTTICGPYPVPLSVESSIPGFYNYSWNHPEFLNSSSASHVVAVPTENTEFTVTVTTPEGCTNSASISVELLSLAPPVIVTPSSTVCSVPYPLEVIVEGDPADYTFSWTPNVILDDLNSPTVNAFPPGGTFNTLEVFVTNNITGCIYSDTQNLSALYAEFDLPSDTIICDSEGFMITYEIISSVFNAINWDDPEGVLNNDWTAFPTITTPNFNGDLIVTFFVPGNGGCSVSDTITIITQNLEYNAPDILSVCFNETVQGNITGDFSSIIWESSPNLDITIPTQPIFSNSTAEVFHFTLDQDGLCQLTDSVQVILNLPPSFEIGASGPFCEGNENLLNNPLEGLTYLWSNGATSEDIVVFTSGTYEVQVTDSAGCSVSDDIVIETILTTPFEIIGDTSVCFGESINLTADIISDNYLWSNNSMEQSTSYTPNESQIIWAEVVDLNNCVYRDSIDIFVSEPILIEIVTEGQICGSTPVTLEAIVENVEIQWSTGESGDQITVSDPGTYSLQATDSIGCSSMESIEITQVIYPQLSLDTLYCEGESVNMNPEVSSDFDLSWSTGEISSEISIGSPGSYSLTLTNMNCDTLITFEVVEVALPMLQILTEEEFCQLFHGTHGYLLTAISDGEIYWLNSSEPYPTLVINEVGSYLATAINEFGCITEVTTTIYDHCPEPEIYVPNSFTPNDDGINDYWRAEFDGELASFSLNVFDRNGQNVFSSDNQQEYWMGNARGGEYFVMDGVYNYLINYSYNDPSTGISTKVIRGHVVLIR